jgi:ribonuclease J
LVVPLSETLNMPDDRVMIMCTGAQGEPTSILGRLSRGEQKQFDIKPHDTVVLSSKVIPGNEEAVFSTINDLFRLGANVIYEEIAPVHVSGHGSQEDIKLLIHLTKPKYFIPAYGEVRHLMQASVLARQTGIPEENIAVVEDGQVVTFKNSKMKLGERVPAAMVFVDGSLVGDIGPQDLKDREMLSRDGIIIVHINLSEISGKLFSKPEVASRGFMAALEAERVLAQTIQPIEEVVARSNGNLEGAVVRAVKDVVYRHTRRNPTVIVTVSRV